MNELKVWACAVSKSPGTVDLLIVTYKLSTYIMRLSLYTIAIYSK